MFSKFFYRPKGFQDENKSEDKENEYADAMKLKSKALKEIDLIDSKPYTLQSFARREELIEVIKECNKKMNSLSAYKPIDNRRTIRNNLQNISNSDELLEKLCSQNSILNNMEKDKRSIKEYLDNKRINKYKHFMYEESKSINDISASELQNAVDPSRSSDAFIISNTGVEPNISDVNYRITIRNSNTLKNENVLSFLKSFQTEALKRNIYVRCKVLFEQSDGIIFYVDKDNLLNIVNLLEDLKDERIYGLSVINAINNFGKQQPFSATLDDDSYYSIAMHGVEPRNSRIHSTLGGGLISTFNGYMDNCLDAVYSKLLDKYKNNISKISVDEFYEELITLHKNNMNIGEEMPLWMNNRIYNDLYEKGLSR